MSLLENLALGLRQAGGVLNPQVQQMTARQDELQTNLAERRRDLMAQQLIRAAEMGAIEPEAAKMQLQRLGYGGMAVGPGIEAQQRAEALRKTKAYEGALAGLGANPTEEQLAQVAAQFAGPDKALDVLHRTQSRRDAIVQRAEDAERAHQQRVIAEKNLHEARLARLSNDADRAAETARHNRATEIQAQQHSAMIAQFRNMAAGMRQPPAPHITTDSQGRIIAIDRSGVATPVRSEAGEPVLAQPKPATLRQEEQRDQRGSSADFADILVNRLESLLQSDPRSVTGLASGVTRGIEGVANTVAPGSVGSQATIAKQTKEQLIGVLSTMRGGGMGRLSNQDMRRVDAAIGAINSGTQEGMQQGLNDTRTLIKVLRGGAPAVRGTDRDLIDKYLKPNG